MGLSEQITSRRKLLGFTQAELARRADVSKAHLHHLETTGSAPSADLLYRLAVALESSMEELLEKPALTPAGMAAAVASGVLREVAVARSAGNQDLDEAHHPERWVALLTRGFLNLTCAVLDEKMDESRTAAVSLAAIAVAFLEDLDRLREGADEPGTVAVARKGVRSHPSYQDLVSFFRSARGVWASDRSLRDSMGSIGVSEKEYCFRCIDGKHPMIRWTGEGKMPRPLGEEHYEAAFVDAAVD